MSQYKNTERMSADDELREAWRAIKSYVSPSEVVGAHEATARRIAVAMVLDLNERTIRDWLNSDDNPPRMRESSRDAVIKLYKNITRLSDPYWYLAGGISDTLNLISDDFSKLRVYEGDYRVFRHGNDGLIEGRIRITNNNKRDPYMLYHSSEEEIGGRSFKFDHKGPIFINGNNIYALCVGQTDVESYFRPMILRMVSNPKGAVTYGIVLTERYETYAPMAMRVAIVSEEYNKSKKGSIKDEILEGLKNRSINKNILYA